MTWKMKLVQGSKLHYMRVKRKWAVRKGKRSAMIYPHTFPRLAILLCYLFVCQEDVAPSLVVCSRKRVYSC